MLDQPEHAEPEPDRALGLFYLGYPACPWPSGNRGPVEDKVTWMDR